MKKAIVIILNSILVIILIIGLLKNEEMSEDQKHMKFDYLVCNVYDLKGNVFLEFCNGSNFSLAKYSLGLKKYIQTGDSVKKASNSWELLTIRHDDSTRFEKVWKPF